MVASLWRCDPFRPRRRPNLRGYFSAASTMSIIFSEGPARTLRRIRLNLSLTPPRLQHPGSFSLKSLRLPCRAFASRRSKGSKARAIATISEGLKFFRTRFSAASPRTILSRSSTVTGTFVQPSDFTARSRRSPAIKTPSGRTTGGCNSPISSMLLVRARMSPRSLRCRLPTRIEESGTDFLFDDFECINAPQKTS